MEEVQIKTEVQQVEGSDEILLYYVDENGGNEEGIVTTIQNMDEMQEDGVQTVYMEQNETEQATMEFLQQEEAEPSQDRWSDYDTNRLLVFYIDNKDTFTSGVTKKNFLWSVACKTMLMGKTPTSCENKLRNLKKKYIQVVSRQQTAQNSYFELLHQAFHDDSYVQMMLTQNQPETVIPDMVKHEANDGIVVVQNVDAPSTAVRTNSNVDQRIVALLTSYIKHKNSLKNVQKDYWQRGLWETIALEMGEEDAEYWHKKFLNHKHNYVRMLEKRRATGDASITWPYMQLFDQIFGDDQDFQRKYNSNTPLATPSVYVNNELKTLNPNTQNIWNDTEITVLVKYYFDCFEEFQDPTIPNNFLWNEIGRLLDKNPELCKTKHSQLKTEHYSKYLSENYNLIDRKPVDILFDNIIARETMIVFAKFPKSHTENVQWKTELLDELAQFLYNNGEMFKDPICYYVCWCVIARKIMKPMHVCREKWEELVLLYKSILQDKKDNPDLQIDWRYIELFDRLFDYGMDEKLMEGFENVIPIELNATKVGVKKVNISMQSKDNPATGNNAEEEFDERGFTTHSKKSGNDAKTLKILEFYIKNKEKFATGKKIALWGPLSKEIKISPTDITNKLKTLKQVYTSYVLREINKPDMPVVWPFYQLCKKAFGYRALKSKLKLNKDDRDSEEWSTKEIKELVAHFAKNFHEIETNPSDTNLWTELASSIKKSESACRDKFVELRKSYRKIKTMKEKRSNVKVTWKYYNSWDEIYNIHQNGSMVMDIDEYEEVPVDEDIKQDIQEDDDIQCIIVIPEGQDAGDLNNAQIPEITNGKPETTLSKWTKASKKRLLTLYLNYVKSHKGKEIDAQEMWKEVAGKLPKKTPLACRKLFAKLKQNRLSIEDEEVKKKTPYYAIMEKILTIKPKFKKNAQKNETSQVTDKVYKDVPMPAETVQKALELYLQNIAEFVSPKYEKKYAWNNLAKEINEPVSKVFNKINYMKQSFNNGLLENLPFLDKLQEISEKEIDIKAKAGQEKLDATQIDEKLTWSDSETEQLLMWYLDNLDKFKNPKFVRKYLWIESSNLLSKSPLACLKKMSEIRTQYRNMVKETPDGPIEWRFYELCQKIYGTGKQKVLVPKTFCLPVP